MLLKLKDVSSNYRSHCVRLILFIYVSTVFLERDALNTNAVSLYRRSIYGHSVCLYVCLPL